MKFLITFHIFFITVFYAVSAPGVISGFAVSPPVKTTTLSGTVRDADTGEPLVGAVIMLADSSVVSVSGRGGRYQIDVPSGRWKINYTYIGYKPLQRELELSASGVLNVQMEFDGQRLETVTITSHGANSNVMRTEMGVQSLSAEQIKNMPALLGEVDVIKALQMLPGVQAASEGSTGFSVRGGSHDQNLILLDDATVYNASHLMGFFSVFNNDAIQDVTLYKGDIPASFGGRLSSLLDIRARDGAPERIGVTGGLGLISSRVTVDGPLAGQDATFLVSGRRTYADLFLKLAPDKDLRNSTLYFYDANVHLSWRPGKRDKLQLNGYLGRDKLGTSFAGMDFGNKTLSLKWTHTFSRKLFLNVSANISEYDYGISADISSQLNQWWKSTMQDYGAKAEVVYHPGHSTTLRTGYQAVYHTFQPGIMRGKGDDPLMRDIVLNRQYSLEQGVFASGESEFGRLKLRYGLRYSIFSNISNGKPYTFLEDYLPSHSITYKRGGVFNTFRNFEPRAGITYVFSQRHSLKASYARLAQYIHLASNSAAGSPLDVWFHASPNIEPQMSEQFSFGYFRNFNEDMYEASAEIYYRDFRNVIDFRDHADLIMNEELEEEIRTGKGYSYGLELMVRKNRGTLTGWVSYTYARARRRTDAINNGRWYRSPYDKPHSISIVASFNSGGKWDYSLNWIYATGTPVTYPIGRYRIEGNYVPIYSGRNEYRYPDYHRLDLSATCLISKPGRRVKSELNFSLYNAYGRKNPWAVTFSYEDDQPDVLYAKQIYLFSFVPSITWNFTF